MIKQKDLVRVAANAWEIPKSYSPLMRCNAKLYAAERDLESLMTDKSLDQLVNITSLPGIEYACAMPDIHQGYGFPIGGVAAIRASDGVISPGGVGYDINCGVRVLTSPFPADRVRANLQGIATQMQRDVPSGVGKGGEFELTRSELNHVLNQGVPWAIRRGYGWAEDPDTIEEGGAFPGADAEFVSSDAKERGRDQLGTIGSGNHFIEVQEVVDVREPRLASRYGLFLGQAVIMIHTGSRGLGHQVCTDYVKLMNKVRSKYGIDLPDRELACAPFNSDEGQMYFKAMAAAANYAWTNRQLITFQVRNAWKRALDDRDADKLPILYDVSHNIAKLEEHGNKRYVVHRKGATRAFGPGSRHVPERYRDAGQPVLIPGSMGTFSYILAGTEEAMVETFGSSCHGAGRRLSRTAAKRSVDYNALRKQLDSYGVVVRAGSSKGLVEEAPQAYKDVSSVVDVIDDNRIAKVVAQLRPIAVLKG